MVSNLELNSCKVVSFDFVEFPEIKGFVPHSLVDWDGKVCAVIFLGGCNLRCRFCSNKDLVLNPEKLNTISFEDIKNYIKRNKNLIDGVVITGGEPCIHRIFELCKELKKFSIKIKLDTNGCFPKVIEKLVKYNLIDYIAMDIKCCKDYYHEITGVNTNLKNIEKSIKLISKFDNYEFRTTIVEKYHSKENIKKMLEWVCELIDGKIKKFCLQSFKHFEGVLDDDLNSEVEVEEEFLKELEDITKQFCNKVCIRV